VLRAVVQVRRRQGLGQGGGAGDVRLAGSCRGLDVPGAWGAGGCGCATAAGPAQLPPPQHHHPGPLAGSQAAAGRPAPHLAPAARRHQPEHRAGHRPPAAPGRQACLQRARAAGRLAQGGRRGGGAQARQGACAAARHPERRRAQHLRVEPVGGLRRPWLSSAGAARRPPAPLMSGPTQSQPCCACATTVSPCPGCREPAPSNSPHPELQPHCAPPHPTPLAPPTTQVDAHRGRAPGLGARLHLQALRLHAAERRPGAGRASQAMVRSPPCLPAHLQPP
jgi:hypothetical protein